MAITLSEQRAISKAMKLGLAAQVERYFEETAALAQAAGGQPDPVTQAALAAKYGITFVP